MQKPSLFTRVAEGFPDSKLPKGHPLLQYGDKTRFFIEGSMEMVWNISELLDLFANFLGFGPSREEGIHCSEALGTLIEHSPMRF